MKKKMAYAFMILILAIILTACSKVSKKSIDPNAAFTIECIAAKDKGTGIDVDTVVTYNFDDNQYLIGYTSTTKQKFNDKDTYREYKKAQEKTIKDNSEKMVSYKLKSNDKKMILEFSMIIKMNVKDAKTDEEKDALRAMI